MIALMAALRRVQLAAALLIALAVAGPAAAQGFTVAPPTPAGSTKLIATVTASASSAITFTSLGGYNTVVLFCTNVIVSGDNGWVLLQVGEGGTPTWETTVGSYSWALNLIQATNAAQTSFDQAGQSQAGIAIMEEPTTGGTPGTFTVTMQGMQSNTATKGFLVNAFGWFDAVTSDYLYFGGGGYTGDTNPITQIRLTQQSGGTFTTGSCSLYGRAT